MIHFPHAKINLGLSVVARRADGFHDIETLFYPVPLFDVLEILPAETPALVVTGLPVPGKPEDNLLFRAYHAIRALHPALPSVGIRLHKNIPMGAGLGGGSSDAASLLLMLNRYFELGLGDAALSGVAAGLGSDCAFFLKNQPCIGTGRGEKLEPVRLDLSAFDLLLVHPGVSVSTAWAYARIVPASPPLPLKTVLSLPPAEWKEKMVNSFEAPVFAAHPELARIKSDLYESGAIYAAMTGSGSTVFGLFPKGSAPEDLFAKKYAQHLVPAGPAHQVW